MASEAALPAKLAVAEAELRAALLAGDPTEAIRTRIVRFQAEIRDTAARAAAKAAKIEQAEAAEAAQHGAELATESAGRIAGLMADLQPPPWPLLS